MPMNDLMVRRILQLVALAFGCAAIVGCSQATEDTFYATGDNKLLTVSIKNGNAVTITPVGATEAFGCASLALSSRVVRWE